MIRKEKERSVIVAATGYCAAGATVKGEETSFAWNVSLYFQ